MSIITRFKVGVDNATDRLELILDRDYPETYNERDRFTLEKYELDLNDENIRFELRNAIKSQTVMQYMSEYLLMSSCFWMTPLTNATDPEKIVRSADFGLNPELIDITEFIKSNNTRYLDQTMREDHLYLYRIVYSYNFEVFCTDYVAAFERISDTFFTSERTGRPIYKTLVSDDTLKRLFGDAWPNIRKFFDTEQTETRIRYRQDPVVCKVPGRRFNARYRGPLEDYKLLAAYREAGRHIKDSNTIHQKISEEIADMYTLAGNVDRAAALGFGISERDLVLIRTAIEDLIGSGLLNLVLKTPDINRIIGRQILGDMDLVPNLMKRNGLYILVSTAAEAQQVAELIEDLDLNINQPIFIALPGSQVPLYTFEVELG